MSTYWAVKNTHHCGLWEDKMGAVYVDNKMTNEQGYKYTQARTHTHKPYTNTHTYSSPMMLSQRIRQACAWVWDHVYGGLFGMDAGDG